MNIQKIQLLGPTISNKITINAFQTCEYIALAKAQRTQGLSVLIEVTAQVKTIFFFNLGNILVSKSRPSVSLKILTIWQIGFRTSTKHQLQNVLASRSLQISSLNGFPKLRLNCRIKFSTKLQLPASVVVISCHLNLPAFSQKDHQLVGSNHPHKPGSHHLSLQSICELVSE